MKRTDTSTLAKAMDALARDIQSGDGVANAAIHEAAERLRELERERDEAAKEALYYKTRYELLKDSMDVFAEK
jgi:hypothetical protein